MASVPNMGFDGNTGQHSLPLVSTWREDYLTDLGSGQTLGLWWWRRRWKTPGVSVKRGLPAQVSSRFGESQNYFSGAGVGVCVWYLSGSGIPSNEAKYNSLFLFFLSSFLLR